jgi:hypothetical protein
MPPLTTNFDVNPYWDDYNPSKDYSKILFKPAVAVQARELNQLQTMLQNQIEQFGDNIYVSGTIIQGCNFIFYDNYPYIKINDNDVNGNNIIAANFLGLNIVDSSNLISLVVQTVPGFESQDPNLNTLYLKYINSGVSGNDTAYTTADTLTVYNGNNVVEYIQIANGSSLFVNTDFVVFASALAITNTTGGLTFSNGSSGANVFNIGDVINYVGVSNVRSTILAINSTANSTALILQVAPLLDDLEVSNSTPLDWTFSPNTIAVELTTNTQFTIAGVIGSGASATLVTTGFGTIANVVISSPGVGYYISPYVTIASQVGDISSANLIAQTYLTKITVASVANPAGMGYAFGVTDGVIYQKGYFSLVTANTIIVDKYSNTPDQLVVGFNTLEAEINSNQDPSLLDNAAGSPNFAAPGADRLQLTPILVVMSAANAALNAAFFPIVGWNGGLPYKQNQQTQFNTIEAEIAEDLFNTSGNFVLDPFLITTEFAPTLTDELTEFLVYVDPGTAYVEGYEVNIVTPFSVVNEKATTTQTLNPDDISINYGNYVLVNNLGGTFEFQQAAQVFLFDSPSNYLSNTQAITAAPAANGNLLGTARIRSITYNSLNTGAGNTGGPVYRMYLFDIQMGSGANFGNVASIYANNSGAFTGIADIVQANGVTSLQETGSNDSIIFPTGVIATESISNLQYAYRATSTFQANTTGNVVATSASGEVFLNSSALYFETILVPQANIFFSNATGTVSVATSTANVTGTTTTFLTTFVAGDYVALTNSTATEIKQIIAITNNTFLVFDTPPAMTDASANIALALPESVPVNMFAHGRAINFNSSGNTMTINLGNTPGGTTNCSLTYTAVVLSATPISKSVSRDVTVQIDCTNNVNGTTGPWILGVPDVIRLDSVILLSASNTDVTSDFVILGGQTEDYVDLAQLALAQGADVSLIANSQLLVTFDCLVKNQDGVSVINSYPVNDGNPFNSSPATINTLEIPELYGDTGTYYDLRDCIDFRPIVIPTANILTTTVNPPAANDVTKFGNTASTSNNKRFPHPISVANMSATYYLGRIDIVALNANGTVVIVNGTPDVAGKVTQSTAPVNTLILNGLNVPPYPSLPLSLSANDIQFSDTSIVNGKIAGTRKQNFTITIASSSTGTPALQPQGYTMQEIGELEQRIQNLEQVVLLQMLNNTANNIGTTQFGFIADDFSTTDYLNMADPEWNASIINGQLGPFAAQFNLPFVFASANGYATLPYIPYALVQQLNATGNSVIVPTPVVYHGIMEVKPTTYKIVGTFSANDTTQTSKSTSTTGGRMSNTSSPTYLPVSS